MSPLPRPPGGPALLACAVLSAAGCRPSADPRVAELEARVAALEARLAELPADSDSLKAAEVAELVARLDSGDAFSRWRAGAELADRGAEAHRALLDAVRTGSRRQQEAAAAVLARSADPDLAPDLVTAHADAKDHDVRALLAAALGRTARPEAVDALLLDLASPERRVRSAAARALKDAGDPRAAHELVRAATANDPLVAPLARDAARSLGEGAVAFLAQRWSAYGPRQRQQVILMFGDVPGPRVEELLVTSLQDASPLVALDAALMLAQRGSTAGRALAQQRVGSDDPVVARRAREVLDALELIPAP